jgi:hypothetical protein
MLAFEAMQRYLSEVSVFGPSVVALALALLLTVDIVLTLVHSVQEFKGRLWCYFGNITGVHIPDLIGFPLLSVALTAILWTVGFTGIAGYLPLYGAIRPDIAVAALGGLIGGCLSDRRYSHVLLDRQGFRPNPGLSSTPYYFAEAVILTVLFIPGIWGHYIAASVGFLTGWLFFYSILPVLRFLRRFPSLRREP